jgi:hypothetical protein
MSRGAAAESFAAPRLNPRVRAHHSFVEVSPEGRFSHTGSGSLNIVNNLQVRFESFIYAFLGFLGRQPNSIHRTCKYRCGEHNPVCDERSLLRDRLNFVWDKATFVWSNASLVCAKTSLFATKQVSFATKQVSFATKVIHAVKKAHHLVTKAPLFSTAAITFLPIKLSLSQTKLILCQTHISSCAPHTSTSRRRSECASRDWSGDRCSRDQDGTTSSNTGLPAW